MTIPTGRQVLQLYRDLLRYGRQLRFTDKDCFARRIRKEFKQAKNIDNAEDIKFYYQVSREMRSFTGSETSALTGDHCSREYFMSHLIILHPCLVSIIYDRTHKTTNPSSGGCLYQVLSWCWFIQNCCEALMNWDLLTHSMVQSPS